MLTIYSASAGTGKTHTLTGEYLSLLFKGKERHRRILAVTFTNKATAEMKSRIIEELFRLANNQPSDFLKMLSGKEGKNEQEIRAQAKQILQSILHDYSAFRISTIDRFFQQTLRAFTREIGLQGNYQIELDEDLMLEKAVDHLLATLEKKDNESLINWLLRFMEDQIEENGKWDIRKNIIALGRQLFKETYKTHNTQIQEEIKHKQVLTDYLNTLRQIIRATRKKAKELGEQGVLLMKHYGMKPSDFIRGHQSPFFTFEWLSAGEMKDLKETFRVLADNQDAYLAKTASTSLKQTVEQLYTHGMNALVQRVIAFYDDLTDYHTAVEIVRHFYALGILTDLALHIANWREDKNKMLLTDSTELLNKIIDGSEVPFIYEKTGVHIDHYMIDEFQDTSVMQWSNFHSLLKDSLDSGRRNMVVGDVKQSIYRFRNSDWKLLESQVKNDFSGAVKEVILNTNWRSCPHIVQFNNMLFEHVPTLLQQAFNREVEQSSLSADEKESFRSRIVSVYKDCYQHVAQSLMHKEGHVRVHFLPNDEENKWKEQSMALLPHIVEQLQDHGYRLRDMALLTRTNPEGMVAAKTLLDYKETHPDSTYKYDIITEDSLTIGSSLSVRWMIEMLRALSRPDVACFQKRAQVAYAVLRLKNEGEDRMSINRLLNPFNAETNEKLKQLSNRSLYELVEGLFSLFSADIPENELVYFQSFLDAIADFSASETADLGQFLQWWDDTGKEKKIVTPDTQNAIRIMTMHKSKGLGFKVVIIPFAEWKVDRKDGTLWCRPNKKPFDDLSLLPVKYSSNLKNTIFASDYFSETLYNYVDNLNVLYVALTRAKEELIVVAPKTNTKALSIANLLWDGVSADPQYVLDDQSGIYERGHWNTSGLHPVTSVPETEEWPMTRLCSLSPDQRIILQLRHTNGLFEEKKRKYGLLMHAILSNIVRQDDICRVLAEKQRLGEINGEEMALLHEKLMQLTSEENVRHWFDGSMKVINETDILFGKGHALRPDRIMIDSLNRVILVDYKFGYQKEKNHSYQIAEYASLLGEMGYQSITGYLWYFTLNTIEKHIF